METQLQDIIEKIHDKGVKEAESRAREIIEAAERKALERIEAAKAEAEAIVAQAKQDAGKTRDAGEAALQQASRDLLLAVRTRLTELFTAVQRASVGEALAPERLAEMIAALVTAWSENGSDRLDVLLNESDLKGVEKGLRAALSAKLKEGVELKPVRGVARGFRIGPIRWRRVLRCYRSNACRTPLGLP